MVGLPAPVSIAHLGLLSPEDGLSDAQADDFVDIVSTGNAWVKLTGPTDSAVVPTRWPALREQTVWQDDSSR
jgi:hypothetical protein